jgi:phage terminase small subunit
VKDLAAVASSNISHFEFDNEGYVQLAEGAPPEAIKAVQRVRRRKRTLDDGSVVIESEYRLFDKLKALELLGRKLKLFTDRVEVEGAQDQLYRELLRSLKEGQGDHK